MVVQPLALARVERVEQQVAVTEQGPLGSARRPGRVLQVDRIGWRQFLGDPRKFGRRAAPAGSLQVLPSEQPGLLGTVQSDDPAEARQPWAVQLAGARCAQFRADLAQHFHVVRRPERLDQGQPADFRLGQGIFQLRGAIGRIDGYQDRADPRRGELENDPLRPVCGPNAEVIPSPKPQRQQAQGDAVDGLIELGPRPADSRLGEDHRVALTEPLGRLSQHRAHGQAFGPGSR